MELASRDGEGSVIELRSNKMTMPDFLLIGPGRCGTTSLHYYLEQHPQIYMSPVKEPGFLALDGSDLRIPREWKRLSYTLSELGEYQKLFGSVTSEKAIGESSVNYIHLQGVIPRIKKYMPRARLIVNLRNPVEKAYSGYILRIREGIEPLSFGEAISAEPLEPLTDLKWRYYERRFVRSGFHSVHLSRFLESFPREQIGVFFFDDLIADPVNWVKSIYRFLAVDDTFDPDLSIKHNSSRIPRNRRLDELQNRPNALKTLVRFLTPARLRKTAATTLNRRNFRAPPPLSPQTRQRLIEMYRDDINRLQGLVGRDLSHWLEADNAGEEPAA